jgi:hypothetical protein
MKRVVALLLFAFALQAQNTNNDSSCDVSVAPAATLLLPYFEVEVSERGKTTLFTVTNVSHLPQAAHVTLWTDYGYPVLTFNLYLTPYDVQPINLYDVIVGGVIAADAGPPGSACAGLPREVPRRLQSDVGSALTKGVSSSCTGATEAGRIGGDHGSLAVGYATIDVVKDCSSTLATSEAYFRDELRFDNVLIGEYETIDPVLHAAAGGPLVHIRAVPEGGPAGAPPVPTALPYTFYSRYLGNLEAGFDRRQPLPAMFAARFLQSGGSGFSTQYRIWREGSRGALPSCVGYIGTNRNAVNPTKTTAGNSYMPITEIVRWDEHGNPFSFYSGVIICCVSVNISAPSVSSQPADSALFPAFASPAGDSGGWMYFNLNSGLVEGKPATRPSQGWVITSMTVPGLYEVDFDAASMGNGCTPVYPSTSANLTNLINPAGLVPVCPPNSRPEICRPGVPPYIGRN